jgi:imidazolonepropionase-like amidohydrolase
MMRRLLIAVALLVVPFSAGVAEQVAIVGGTAIIPDAEPLTDAVILVDDGRIVGIGADLAVPDDYQIVDATGKVVTSGLIESYSQLSLVEIGGEATTVDSQVSEYPAGAAFDVRYALNPASIALAVNRRDGVTRAIVAPTAANDPFAGWGVAIRLAGDSLLTETDIGLFGSVGAQSAGFVGGSRSSVIQRMRRGLQMAPGYNQNRYHPGPGDYSHQDLAALKRFLGSDAPLVLQVHRANEIREAVALTRDFDLRLILLGATEAWQVAELLAEHQVPVMVNVLANTPISYDRLGARLDNAALLNAAGVSVMLTGGESQNARRLRQMAGNAVAHGMPWMAALAAITQVPGEVWRLQPGTGTLTARAPADLVIWSGDPLELSTWAERVMIDGQWQDLSSRQTRLFERYRDLQSDQLYYGNPDS